MEWNIEVEGTYYASEFSPAFTYKHAISIYYVTDLTDAV